MGYMEGAFLRVEYLANGVSIEGHRLNDEIPLGSQITRFGRPTSVQPVPDIKIQDPEKYVSRDHAEIRYDPKVGGYKISDRSECGTFLGNIRLDKNTEYLLKHGERIGFAMVAGEMRVEFSFSTSSGTKKLKWLEIKERRVYVRNVDNSHEEIDLSEYEYKVLEALYSSYPTPCHKDDIIGAVWGKEILLGKPKTCFENNLSQVVIRLRRKFLKANRENPIRIDSKGRRGLYVLVLPMRG